MSKTTSKKTTTTAVVPSTSNGEANVATTQVRISTAQVVNQIDGITNSLVQDLPNVVENLKAFINAAKQDLSLGFEKAKEDYDLQLKNLNLDFAQKKDAILADYEAYTLQLKSEREKELEVSKSNKEKLAKEEEDLKYTHQTQLRKLEGDYKVQVQELDLAHQRALTEKREDVFLKLASVLGKANVSTKDYDSLVANFSNLSKDFNAKLEEIKQAKDNDLKTQLAAQKEKFDYELKINQAENLAKIQALEAKVAFLSESNATVSANMTKMVNSLSDNVSKGTQVVGFSSPASSK